MRFILPIIVIAQFFCTSVWFAGNAIVGDIGSELNLDAGFLAHLTSAIQFGFISGTLVFAVFTLSDRFSPSLVFFFCAVLAGFFNLGISLPGIGAGGLLLLRFLTGFCLAGIYPVGMKIASDYFQQGLGKSLGFLVGALVLGTAFPHLLKSMGGNFPWRYVVYATTVLSWLGGLFIFLFVPSGPFRRSGQSLSFTAFLTGFRHPAFRSVAFGYFGHMWELYTFWAFVPVILAARNAFSAGVGLNIPITSFGIIAPGALACVAGGLLSQPFGAKRIAGIALFLSCLCCLVSPFMLVVNSPGLFVGFMVFWGLVVIADSPLFSTLVAQHAPAESRGTSLTIVNCIGFSITIISIQSIQALSHAISMQYLYMVLAIGPIFGLIALAGKRAPSIITHIS